MCRHRILDANLNRLNEGLRVVEDVCRFGLDDAATAGALKRLRHEATALRRELPRELMSARDARSDVGRERVAESDRRENLAETLAAAWGRVKESLRAIEEMAKLGHPAVARHAKVLRFRSYDLERETVARFDRGARAARLRGLYLVMTDPCVGYERLTEAAVAERVAVVQLRDKRLESGALLELARRLSTIVRGSQTLLILNDRPDLARLAGADGVHVGQTDVSVADARRIVGDRALVGKSTHNLGQLAAALKERPDYVGVGPVFPTTSKACPDRVLGLEKTRRMVARCPIPSVAIGGVEPENLAQVLKTGATCYGLIRAVGLSRRPRQAIRRLRQIEEA